VKRKSLRLPPLEAPSEESVFADFEEFLTAFHSDWPYFLRKEVVVAAKLFFRHAVHRILSRDNAERGSLGEANAKRVRQAEHCKKTALIAAAHLLKRNQSLRQPRMKSRLAKQVRTELAKNGGRPPAERTIRRWLDEMIPSKK
jgi:hypothetical protein